MDLASVSTMLGPFFSSAAMELVFCDGARLQAMLDVEAALGQAQARMGVIPAEAALMIAEAARAEHFNPASLGREVINSGNLAIPLVKALTALVAERDEEAARFVHWGATSQDVIDTGLVLQMREALGLIARDIQIVGDHLAELAQKHIATPMIARTLMQQATPTTLGLKIAGWLSALGRSRTALSDAAAGVSVLQFGGASGNLAALGGDGMAVAQALADELRLALPDMPWHTQRDRIAATACALGVLTGSLSKMARDLALMAQTEIGEFGEPAGDGRGGSSAMPHKANPVACARILAVSRRAPGLIATLLAAMDQEHERALGGWQVEWEALPELFRLTSAALEAARFLAENGRFDMEKMRANLKLTNGLVMAEAISIALGRKLGKAEAHHIVERTARQAVEKKRPLRDCLSQVSEIAAHISEAELEALFRPENHLGAAPEFVNRAISAWRD